MTAISIFGLGYVGTVTAACLAHKGNRVLGIDLSASKVEALDSGRSPIVEPKVSELIAASNKACHLHATMDPIAAVMQTDVSFLCVGTPSLRNGNLDLGHIGPVCEEIGKALRQKRTFHLIVLRSTVLPGTAESIVIPTLEKHSGKRMGKDFGVCVNPEFMREGTAVADFFEPAITIIGSSSPEHAAILRNVYNWVPGQVFETSFRSAEMVKYVCNAWHALKVSFANEVGALAKCLDVNAAEVISMFSADTKLNISSRYLKPGFAFGGSCLPKDVRALTYRARELDLNLPLLKAIMPSNEEHLARAIEMVLETGKNKVGMLGLSFKAATDDLRESPQVQMVKRLVGEGKQVQIWDENVTLGRLIGSNREYIDKVIPHIGSLLSDDVAQVVKNAEVIVVGTRAIPKDSLEQMLAPGQAVVDLVNIEEERRAESSQYEGICW